MEIELTNFSQRAAPKDKVLFNEVLCVLISNQFKQLQVKLTRSSSSEDGATAAFQLQIQGIGHQYHLEFSFTVKDLCFLHREEQWEDVKDACVPCLNLSRNSVYTRLTLLWHLTDDDGVDAPGHCVKVPFIQRGNRHAATMLQKLESTIHEHVATSAELKHWQVYVKKCGSFSEGLPLLLALTKFALVIIYQYKIVYHHSLLMSSFTTSCTPGLSLIEIDVTDKNWIMENGVTENFALTRRYIFSTIHGRQIEMDLKSLHRQSLNQLGKPPIHLNIHHEEQSATDFVPGTTSDNVGIPYHVDYSFQSGESSGSNGHIPNTNITVDIEPRPHSMKNIFTSGSSNGHIPGTSSSSGIISQEILRINNDRPPFNLPDSDSSDDGILNARGPSTAYPMNIPLDSVSSQTHTKIMVQARNKPTTSEVRMPTLLSLKHRERLESESSPIPICHDVQFPQLHHDSECWTSESMSGMASGFENMDLLELPPPKPCGARPHPVTYITCWSFGDGKPDDVCEDTPPLPRKLFRSQSVRLLNESELPNHLYVNTEQMSAQLRNIHDDSPYYRFYYNFGFIHMMDTRMSLKIKRWRRLSKDVKQLDSNLLDKHENWFDKCFKTRDKDLRFCRLSRMNIQPQPNEDTGTGYSKPAPQESMPDDPYWNGDLCVTLQAKLQKKTPSVQEVFDVTQEQLLGIQVLLSLVPSERNWKELAEHIGLVSTDIAIIEHFCYTYRELAGEVVLAHWTLQYQRGKSHIACTRENLIRFLDEIGRNDIMNVLLSTSDNVNVQTPGELDEITKDFEVTHF